MTFYKLFKCGYEDMRDNELTTNLKNLITIVDVFVIDFLVLQVKRLIYRWSINPNLTLCTL